MKTSLSKTLTATALALALGCAALSVKAASAAPPGDDVTVGTFAEGHQVGLRNGALIAERVHKKTVGKHGCRALNDFQNALNVVTARVRPASNRGTRFTAGFYQGYVDAIKDAVKETRTECKQRRFSDGLFPGAIFGNVFCQAAYEDPAALESLAFGPIYEDWSADKDTRDACEAAFAIVTGDCFASGIASQLLAAAQAASCAE